MTQGSEVPAAEARPPGHPAGQDAAEVRTRVRI